jgi:hypothetical protein
MRQSRSSVLPETGDEKTLQARSLLVPRLMGAVGVLTLVASFGLMAASAPAQAGVRHPHTSPATCSATAPARPSPPPC